MRETATKDQLLMTYLVFHTWNSDKRPTIKDLLGLFIGVEISASDVLKTFHNFGSQAYHLATPVQWNPNLIVFKSIV